MAATSKWPYKSVFVHEVFSDVLLVLHEFFNYIVKNFAALRVLLDDMPQGNGQGDSNHDYLIVGKFGDQIQQFLFEDFELVEVADHESEGFPLNVFLTQPVALY